MRKKNEYNLVFSGLKKGIHEYDYTIDSSFFEIFDYDEFQAVNVNVHAVLNKKDTLMELTLTQKGTVGVTCDLTNEPFDLPVESELNLVIKFGEAFNDDHDEILVLPHGAFEFNIAQFIYEMIVLSVPLKRVHPSVQEEISEDEEDDMQNLVYVASTSEEEEETKKENEIDPRWSKLANLLTDNKN